MQVNYDKYRSKSSTEISFHIIDDIFLLLKTNIQIQNSTVKFSKHQIRIHNSEILRHTSSHYISIMQIIGKWLSFSITFVSVIWYNTILCSEVKNLIGCFAALPMRKVTYVVASDDRKFQLAFHCYVESKCECFL